MLHYRAAERREHRRHADAMQAVATGYSAVKSKDGLRVMERLLNLLRKE